ncbi:alpha/beta fold hydrolase [Streptomyces sp. NPDC048595]|uniref:alpha/beta fold hydrolase n=1 Tax=Streptomyces sp. NPDC048595 TaxID=3365576 RepID=UPI0037249212
MGDEAEFFAAYDAALRRWPVAVHSLDVPSVYGTTRVQVCGPEHGTPLVLLPGGGSTSMVWFANIEQLARTHRVYAVDLMGDIGRSVHDGAPLRGAGDLMAWLDGVYEALGLSEAQLCGHSYGAWIALRYALHAPHRVDRLALLEPTGCFAPLSPRYLLRAAPLLVGRTAERERAFRRWETGGASEDPRWEGFLDSTASARRSKVVVMRRPGAAELSACAVTTLVLLAGRSRAHDVRRVAVAARRLLPRVTVATVEDAAHHSVPTERPTELNRVLREFLG